MTEQTKISLKIVAAFVIPFGTISSILNFILFVHGPLNEIDNLAASFYEFSTGNYKWGVISLAFSLLFGFLIIVSLAWGIRKLVGEKKLRKNAWHRPFIFGVIFGILSPLQIYITNEFLQKTVSLVTVIMLAWLFFRHYSLTLEETNEPT